MSTTVTGVMVRDRTPGMFDDIAGVEPAYARLNGLTTLTFAVDLDPGDVEDIWWRMTSRDDVEEAHLRHVNDLLLVLEADPTLENLIALTAAQTRAWLRIEGD